MYFNYIFLDNKCGIDLIFMLFAYSKNLFAAISCRCVLRMLICEFNPIDNE